MAYEIKNGQGTIWHNDKYVKDGNQPYAKGKAKDLQGNDIDITLWIPKSDKIKGFNVTISEPFVHNSQSTSNVPTPDDDKAPWER